MDYLEKRRYPIGRFEAKETYTYEDIRGFIRTLEDFPKKLKKLLKKVSKQDYNKSYRPGGWTVRQIVHHLADSHVNAYIRMKLAVTEPGPVVKLYEETLWAELPDSKELSPKVSLNILKSLHERWVYFLNSLQLEDLENGYFHPEKQRIVPLPEAIALYAWHAKHHLAHIRLALEGEQESANTETTQESVVDTPPTAVIRRRKTSKSEKAAAAPKLSRAEVLERARAARAAKKAAAETPATPTKKAEKTPKAPKAAAAPKLSRAEALALARAARAAKKAAAETPAKTSAKKTAPGTQKQKGPKSKK
jgi:hypothetical protein